MQNFTKNWYVVYTRPKWEKKVAEQLTRKKINSFCPLNRIPKEWNDKKKFVLEPLFASYVFANLSETEFFKVRQTDGVISIAYWLGNPAIIRDEEIETIKMFVSDYANVVVEKTYVNLSDNVRIITEPFVKREGNLLEVRNKTVKAVLPTLGHTLKAELIKESENAESINYFKTLDEAIK
ncbi:MAG: UpxY family transcription antiterminator [Bacteroidetes bacterium]|nr:UpxY family transcription antiterminator [Bacteroidota bacterium]